MSTAFRTREGSDGAPSPDPPTYATAAAWPVIPVSLCCPDLRNSSEKEFLPTTVFPRRCGDAVPCTPTHAKAERISKSVQLLVFRSMEGCCGVEALREPFVRLGKFVQQVALLLGLRQATFSIPVGRLKRV